MQKKVKNTGIEIITKELFNNFQKLFRCMDFGLTMQGSKPLLTIKQMQVLSFFNESDVLHVSRISRELNMSIQSVNNLIKRLEGTGYVERAKNEQDKRLSDIRFTKKGKKTFRIFRSLHLNFLYQILQQLAESERRMVLQSIEQAAALFQKAAIGISENNIKPVNGCSAN